MGIRKHSSTGLREVLGKNTKYVGVSKESYGLTGESLGFLKEVALEPNLKDREEYEQTDVGGEQSRQRVQLEQRPRCRSLPAHLPRLFPGETWKRPFVPLGAEERAARAKSFICKPVSCPLQFGELLSRSAFLCVSDYGDECRRGEPWGLWYNYHVHCAFLPGHQIKENHSLFMPLCGDRGGDCMIKFVPRAPLGAFCLGTGDCQASLLSQEPSPPRQVG